MSFFHLLLLPQTLSTLSFFSFILILLPLSLFPHSFFPFILILLPLSHSPFFISFSHCLFLYFVLYSSLTLTILPLTFLHISTTHTTLSNTTSSHATNTPPFACRISNLWVPKKRRPRLPSSSGPPTLSSRTVVRQVDSTDGDANELVENFLPGARSPLRSSRVTQRKSRTKVREVRGHDVKKKTVSIENWFSLRGTAGFCACVCWCACVCLNCKLINALAGGCA